MILAGADGGAVALAGPPKDGDFRDPRWSVMTQVDIVMGCEVRRWEREEYTAGGLAGDAGQRLRDELAANASLRAGELIERLR